MPAGHLEISSRSRPSSRDSLILVCSAIVESAICCSSRRWRNPAPKLSHMRHTSRGHERRGPQHLLLGVLYGVFHSSVVQAFRPACAADLKVRTTSKAKNAVVKEGLAVITVRDNHRATSSEAGPRAVKVIRLPKRD